MFRTTVEDIAKALVKVERLLREHAERRSKHGELMHGLSVEAERRSDADYAEASRAEKVAENLSKLLEES